MGAALGLSSIAVIAGSFIGLILGGVLGRDWRLVFPSRPRSGCSVPSWPLMLRDDSVRQRAEVDWWGDILFGVGLVAILVAIACGLSRTARARSAGRTPTSWPG